ncbi:MAG: ferrochelatase, partial [Pseudomonadota bacterium]
MRYWHPMAMETALAVKEFNPDSIILLPLYPQFSSTTTASSVRQWTKVCGQVGLSAPTRTICCYPIEVGFIGRSAALVREAYERASAHGKPRILFSAHGLPESVVKSGDPYQWQVEQTSAAIVQAMAMEDLDWVTCYQSRVGPLEWIKPATEDEIKRAGDDGVPLVIYPLAFVSEHSETLVELDIEYRELAEEHHVPAYERARTVDDDEDFIAGLADLVREALQRAPGVTASQTGARLCPGNWKDCPADAA